MCRLLQQRRHLSRSMQRLNSRNPRPFLSSSRSDLNLQQACHQPASMALSSTSTGICKSAYCADCRIHKWCVKTAYNHCLIRCLPEALQQQHSGTES